MIDPNLQVQNAFRSYPKEFEKKLLALRSLIYEEALAIKMCELEETLKWGEPSYLTKNGSTIRLAWRQSNPLQYGIFFNCKTTLIETFREVYREVFKYEGNRAIVFDLNDDVPVIELKHCIQMALCYKKLKHLPLLGL